MSIVAANVISIEKLIEFSSEPGSVAAVDGRSTKGASFARIAEQVLEDHDVPDAPGVYCWGRYEQGQWISIYVGQSGVGARAGLRRRLLFELNTERAFLWSGLVEEIDAIGLEAYPEQWERKYRKDVGRALKKASSTHIHWIQIDCADQADPAEFLEAIEHSMIEHLLPTANFPRPTPASLLAAREVAARIRGR